MDSFVKSKFSIATTFIIFLSLGAIVLVSWPNFLVNSHSIYLNICFLIYFVLIFYFYQLASTRLEARGKLDSALPEEGLDDAGLAR